MQQLNDDEVVLLETFDSVWMRVSNAPIRKDDLVRIEGMTIGRGRPKITSLEVIKITC